MKKTLLAILLLFSSGANAIVLTVGGSTYDIDPITGAETAAQFYDYNTAHAASANTGYEQSNTVTSFLYDGADGLSMFFIMDIYDDGTGGSAQVSLSSSGLAGTGMNFLVRDDPGDSAYSWDDTTGTSTINFRWIACCTDGFALGSIGVDDWSLTTAFNSISGVDSISFLDADGFVATSDISSFTYSNSTSVPEPNALALLSLGLLGLRLRKEKSK